jgi:hypothetical protein
MVAQKKEQVRKKSTGNGIFFVGVVGLVLLVGVFYFFPGPSKEDQIKTTTNAAASTTGFFSNLFKSIANLEPKKNTGLQVSPAGSPIPGQNGAPAQIPPENQSVWKGKIYLTQGNAPFETQPFKEYITIRAADVGPEGVVITGWRLENGRGDKYYQSGGNASLLTDESAYIPSGAKIFIPRGTNYYTPVRLFQNQTATIITGGVLNMGGTPVQGFQINKCSGYLEQLDDYQFFPPLFGMCPMPSKEPQAQLLENSCYKFVQSLNACHTPKFPELTRVGNRLEPGYVDNTPGLSTQCKDYLKEHFSYNACIVNHSGDKDFYQNDWRLFLNHTWEMWGKDRETFTLYDDKGKVVDQTRVGF